MALLGILPQMQLESIPWKDIDLSKIKWKWKGGCTYGEENGKTQIHLFPGKSQIPFKVDLLVKGKSTNLLTDPRSTRMDLIDLKGKNIVLFDTNLATYIPGTMRCIEYID